jgi:hypothetical protein
VGLLSGFFWAGAPPHRGGARRVQLCPSGLGGLPFRCAQP